MAISLEHQIKELEMRKKALLQAIEYVFEGGDRANDHYYPIRLSIQIEIEFLEGAIKQLRIKGPIKGEPTA